MSPAPEPRPALSRSKDGSVHPAAPHLSSLAVELTGKRTGKKGHDEKDEKVVELVVPITKSLRKKLRGRAEDYGWSAEEAAAHVLQAWAEG